MAVVTVCGATPGIASAAGVRLQALTVVATGDVLLHQKSPLIKGAAAAGRAHGTEFDFSGVFANIAPVIQAADLAICHLETPLAEPGGPFRGYPSFSVQPQIVEALTGAGYDTCSTASNHALDAGFDGLVRTVDTLDARGMGHTGTFRSAAESLTPHIVHVGGVRVAQLSWTFGLNGIPNRTGGSGRSTTSTRPGRRSTGSWPTQPGPAGPAPKSSSPACTAAPSTTPLRIPPRSRSLRHYLHHPTST
jgi:poly-gamma-glutamate synthesis protein (capsule biosynthesis protein)